jgi:hypothetical protein
MRTILRAGAIALTTGSVLLGGAVAAHAAPADGVTVKVNQLVLEPGEYGHTGKLGIVIRNNTDAPIEGAFTIAVPIASSIAGVDDAACGFGSPDGGRHIHYCNSLNGAVAPGKALRLTVRFRTLNKPQAYPQIAKTLGTVEAGGVTADFTTRFRSTTGSLRNPKPYVPDTQSALTVTAADVTLARQADGSFVGRVPVTVRNDGDAPHYALLTELVNPESLLWPDIEPSDVCVGAGYLPIPPGYDGVGCTVAGGPLAEGEQRTFEWVLTAPAGTPAGPFGTGTTLVQLESFATETDNADPAANVDTFAITVAE